MGNRIGRIARSFGHTAKVIAAKAENLAAGGADAAKEIAVRTSEAALRKIGHGPETDALASGKLADPALHHDLAKLGGLVRNQPVDGRLFVDGARESDLQQGMIGDCYFVASLAAVARTHPELLELNLVRNDDGTVTVTFYENGQKVPITVDADLPRLRLPLLRSVDLLASSADPDELWPSLYEKAYATWKGSYEAIGNGGWMSEALQAITGRRAQSQYLVPGASKPEEVAQRLREVLDRGLPLTASTRGDETIVGRFEGLIAHHAFTVDDVRLQGSTWYVTLRNPWGYGEPLNAGRPDGTFTMKVSDFVQAFDAATWVESGSNGWRSSSG